MTRIKNIKINPKNKSRSDLIFHIKDTIIRMINDYLENCIYPQFWDHILNPSFGCTPTLLKPHAGGNLHYSNIKVGKSNTQTIFKIMRECSSLYRILVSNYKVKRNIWKLQTVTQGFYIRINTNALFYK